MLLSSPLRKKGGIFIKKLKFFLILIASIFIAKSLTINVKAASAKFYEAAYIDGIYMNKYQPSTDTIFYQKARFFRERSSNEFAYCIEPFASFDYKETYETTITPDNLSQEQIDRIAKIAHFGYHYKDHTGTKWYAITQFMIWQTADPTGDYYFTDSLNGNRIEIFNDEINEINNLVNNYNTIPSFANQTFNIVEGEDFSLIDTNNVLSTYHTNNSDITIENNTLKLNNLNTGNYTYELTREDNFYNKPIVFFNNSNSQDLVMTGDLNPINTKLNINIIKTGIEITKIDKDSQSIIPKGEASLDGAIYNLYDENNNLIKELVIENNQATIKNIPFGKYYLKEIKAGTGYTIDNNTYEIEITKDNNNENLILENKVIEKKITIEKKYGDNYLLKGEKNISFNIYNSNKELITTITTDTNGLVEITLPYGKYEFTQVNSTEGYHKVDSFEVIVDNNDNEIIELKDLKIEVPDTHTDVNKVILYILQMLLTI